MKVIILEQALEELHDAIDYYEEKQIIASGHPISARRNSQERKNRCQ